MIGLHGNYNEENLRRIAFGLDLDKEIEKKLATTYSDTG